MEATVFLLLGLNISPHRVSYKVLNDGGDGGEAARRVRGDVVGGGYLYNLSFPFCCRGQKRWLTS